MKLTRKGSVAMDYSITLALSRRLSTGLSFVVVTMVNCCIYSEAFSSVIYEFLWYNPILPKMPVSSHVLIIIFIIYIYQPAMYNI